MLCFELHSHRTVEQLSRVLKYKKNYLAQAGLLFTARLYLNYIFLYTDIYVVKDTDNSSGGRAASCLVLHQTPL